MGRIQQCTEAAERIITEHGSRAAQHVLDLTQAAIRRNAPCEEMDDLALMMRIIEAHSRALLHEAAKGPNQASGEN